MCQIRNRPAGGGQGILKPVSPGSFGEEGKSWTELSAEATYTKTKMLLLIKRVTRTPKSNSL